MHMAYTILPQGVVTPISIVLRAATGIVTLYTADVGVAYRITPYTTKKSRSHGGFLRRSQGHRQFSSAVTRSQAVFGRSQIVTPVAALSTAHIGVTTPCSCWTNIHFTIPLQYVYIHTSDVLEELHCSMPITYLVYTVLADTSWMCTNYSCSTAISSVFLM